MLVRLQRPGPTSTLGETEHHGCLISDSSGFESSRVDHAADALMAARLTRNQEDRVRLPAVAPMPSKQTWSLRPAEARKSLVRSQGWAPCLATVRRPAAPCKRGGGVRPPGEAPTRAVV